LVAEDNEVNQEVAILMLERLGFAVIVASNGREALRKFGQRPFALILMDCHMPEMDGFAAARAIRAHERDGEGRRVPIIALTANVEKGVQQQCAAAGMDDYLSKPFTEEQLRSVLARWVATPSTSPLQSGWTNRPLELVPVAACAPVLNQDALAKVRRLQRPGKPDVVGKMFDLYLNSAQRLLDDLRAGISARDADRVRIAAHTLKSSSANLGADALAKACSSLEHLAKAQRVDELGAALAAIEERFAPVAAELNAYRAQLIGSGAASAQR
jgi:CheY-like chemotaxis protein/HPt (histidine-containing phosphotransfer) domain-containing protein